MLFIWVYIYTTKYIFLHDFWQHELHFTHDFLYHELHFSHDFWQYELHFTHDFLWGEGI